MSHDVRRPTHGELLRMTPARLAEVFDIEALDGVPLAGGCPGCSATTILHPPGWCGGPRCPVLVHKVIRHEPGCRWLAHLARWPYWRRN